jgi:Domain of unknown function (DUF927)
MTTDPEGFSSSSWPGFLPDDHVLPPMYELRHGSVFQVIERTRNGEAADPLVYRVTYGPLHIAAMAASTDGDQWFDLAWRDGHRPVTRRVDGTILRSGRALVRELGRAGFPAIDADAKHLERYLAAYLFTNHDALEASRMTIARHLGWQDDGSTFVTADTTPWPVEPGQPEQRPALAAHHPHGTLDGWKQAIAPLVRYPVALVALSAAFGAPLLPLLHVNSFTVDVSGRSSRGKSTAGQATISAWADPSPLGNAISTWKSGLIMIEKRLNLVRGIPVLLDETRVVKSPEIVDQVLYQVSMNQGMARGGGYPSELPWHTILISTGEQPALSFTSHEGAAARVLSLRRAPFGTGGQRSADDAQALTDGIRENYGVAGPAFIARLQERLADPDGAAQLRKQHQALADAHATAAGNDIARRRAPLVAALHLGLQLAHEWEISPVSPPDLAVWTELFSEETGREDRGTMALDVVRALIAAQAHRLCPLNTAGLGAHDIPAAGWIGAVIERDGIPATAILPEALAAALNRATPPIAIDAVREAWTEAGTILLDSGKQLPRVRMNGGRPRAYVFTHTVLDADEPTTTAEAHTEPGDPDARHDPVENHVPPCPTP